MEDERAVEELQHMQKTTESICAWLEAHPESLPKARRFAEYYIPTTLKLLHTYNDVQSQQGENAEAIRRDIAGILHTLNRLMITSTISFCRTWRWTFPARSLRCRGCWRTMVWPGRDCDDLPGLEHQDC